MNAQVALALRYMGAREADAALVALVGQGFDALSAAEPRHIMASFPCATLVDIFQSDALAAHLDGCDTAMLFAATLGTEADRLIRRAEATDTLWATALHACAAAKIEAYADAAQDSIAQASRPRFSPGYADFPLSMQGRLLDLLQAGKRIGLFLTDSDMLAPTKSITAVIGLGPPLPGCPADKCARCGKLDCAFRGESIL